MTRATEIDSSGDVSPRSRALRWAWRFHTRFVMWVKALASLFMLLAGTVTTSYNVADLQGYVQTIFHDSVKLPMILGGVTLAYLLMTLALKLPKGFSANIKLNEGE